MTGLTVGPAETKDAEAIVQVHFAAVHQTASTCYSGKVLDEWSRPVTGERIEHTKQIIWERQELCLVAKLDDVVTGFGSVVAQLNELRSLYVRPEAGCQGIGGELLDALEALASDNNLEYLQMDASVNA